MPTMEAVSDKYRTYALDLWGFGDSDKSRPRYEVADYVALLSNFTENMGIREAPIIGHALGASVALEFAVRHPDRSRKVMAVSLPMNPDCINRKLIDFANNSMMAKMLWWRQISYKEVQKEAQKTAEGAINISVQSVAQLDVKGRIELVAQSTDAQLLVVFGEKDDMVDPDPTRELNGNWRNIRQIGLSDSKHFPMLDEAAKFNRLLQDFLDAQEDLSALELKDEWRRRTR
jgi:pimeloyl-ACP methyl ester carboxylesterase